ncbi:MAG: small ribosomal subunit Rsm22 family protein [Acidimicrobiales bacterium]
MGRVRALADELGEALPFEDLVRAATSLSEAYRQGRSPGFLSESETVAYAVTRAPATAAATLAALKETAKSLRAFSPGQHLDLGSGTGAAVLAARALWPGLSQTAVERDQTVTRLASKTLGGGIAWQRRELVEWANEAPSEGYDLVTASYSLGELAGLSADAVMLAGLRASRTALVLVEPGTPDGFANIRRWRRLGLANGAHVAAPCPHDLECPMAAADWCHFSVRVARSRLHRRLKNGTAPFEDEKFSYVVLVPRTVAHERPEMRVLRHPWRSKGRVDLTLCTAEGVATETIRRHDGRYGAASRAEWGSRL